MSPPDPAKKLKRSRAILKPIEVFVKEIRMWWNTQYAAQVARGAPRKTPMPELTEQEAHILQAMIAQGVGKAP